MTNEHPRYLAYMLRLWRVKTDGEQTWRASLESAQRGERRGFADLESLFAFLKQETRDPPQCEQVITSSKREQRAGGA